ncbi:MAG: PKD domain-containing protein [Deltaproteobacteria bacterium]|nr:PKD domain-containing protein [Deltaproteobacteria bacterium]
MRVTNLAPAALTALLLSLACGQGGGIDPVPTARAWATPNSGRAPLTVDLVGDHLGGNDPVRYDWDFGDGATGEGEAVQHTFEMPGDNVVTLTVTDVDGDSDQTEVIIAVTPGILGATVRAVPELGLAPLTVAFTGEAAGGTPPYQFLWTYGDGQTDSVISPTHTFQNPGDYDVVFQVTDATGGTSQSGIRITASSTPVPLAVAAQAFPATGNAPLGVQFMATVNGGSPPYTYNWTFGDGASAQEADPFHGYATAGTFDAQLTVGDTGGNAASDTVTVSVGAPVRVLINEIRYDTTGTDDNCFIELVGDPSVSLTGFSLVGVNGETGTPYASYPLTGQNMPADGFLVLAQSSAHALTLAEADIRTEFANLQNGPDSLQLVKDGIVVDAVGYTNGTTGQTFAGLTFAGEGNPAAGVASEHSLGRNASSADTADNASDFRDFGTPTPGKPNN